MAIRWLAQFRHLHQWPPLQRGAQDQWSIGVYRFSKSFSCPQLSNLSDILSVFSQFLCFLVLGSSFTFMKNLWFQFYKRNLKNDSDPSSTHKWNWDFSSGSSLGTHIFGYLAFTLMALCCLVQFPSFILSVILQLNLGIRGTHLYRMHTNEPFSWHYGPCFTMAHL